MATSTITLHQALQEKNRLAGEIRKTASLISEYNRIETEADGTPLLNTGIDLTQLHIDMARMVDRLVDLKTVITRANVELYPLLARMSERKGLLALYQSLNTREGRERHFESHDNKPKDHFFKVHINLTEQLRRVKEFETEIFNLQREIDRYNSRTMVEIDLM